MKKIRHLDLFSGIGGFALAGRMAWGDRHEVVAFCDNDAFCQNVLMKNFPNVPIYGDIKELTIGRLAANSERQRPVQREQQGRPRHQEELPARGDFPRIDLLTGGFPCQPFSHAGKKRGDKDDRFLWPEMLRVIRETRPTWVVGENVAGIINMALDQVCLDLENEGYEVQPFVIPACALNAPHRRDRVWIVGRRTAARDAEGVGLEGCGDHDRGEGPQPVHELADGRGGERPQATDTDSEGGRSGRHERPELQEGQPLGLRREGGSDASDAGGEEHRPVVSGGSQRDEISQPRFDREEWGRDWREVALATCHDRVDDGLPERLARLPDGSEITLARLRRESLKAYGNAIVPQVAAEIFAALDL